VINHLDTHCFLEICPDVRTRGEIVQFPRESHARMKEYLSVGKGQAFRSMFLYDNTFPNHVQLKGTVSGYTGIYWANFLLIDLDEKNDDLSNSLASTKNIVSRLRNEYEVETLVIQIGFTGNRGFHISLPQSLIGFGPSKYLAKQMIGFWETLIKGCLLPSTKFDQSIYKPNGLIRCPGSYHEKTGLYKIMLTADELFELSDPNCLKEMARLRRPMPDYNQAPECNDWLSSLWPTESVILKPGQRGNARSSRTSMVTSGKNRAAVKSSQQGGIIELLHQDIKEGEGRNVAAFKIASHFSRRGFPAHIVEGMLVAWNNGLSDPLQDDELMRTIRSGLAANAAEQR
jgi:hypothetical protein